MSIGTILLEARESAGLSVEQVSAATRLRRAMVEAFERDDFSLAGGDVYARGHLRAYARAVGLDPAEIIAMFDGQRAAAQAVPATDTAPGGATAPPVVAAVAPASTPSLSGPVPRVEAAAMADALGPERRASRGERRGPNWTAAMLVAIVALLVMGTVGVLTRGGSSGQLPTADPTTSGPAPSQSAPSTPSSPGPSSSAPPVQSSGPPIAARNDVHVVLRVPTGSSWVAATDSAGEQLFEGLLRQGESKQFFDRKRVKLVIGSAGNVELKVNGKELGSPGGAGEVVTVEFAPGDPTRA